VAILGAVLVSGSIVDEAVARRQRSRMSAQVNGKRLKGLKKATFGTVVPTGFGVITMAKRRRGVQRSLSVDCVGGDIRTLPLPVFWPGFSSVPQCVGTYLENSRRSGLKQWTSLGLDVTVNVVEGTRIEGTFRGVIGPSTSNPTEPPIAVEEGSFSVFTRDFGV
jgi:hypothetical protein